MPGPSITIEPVGFNSKPGHTVIITVVNHGKQFIKVQGIATVIDPVNNAGKNHCELTAVPGSLAFHPERFILNPGKSLRVKVTIKSEPSSHLGALFVATHHGVGQVQSGAGVAAQIVLSGKPFICSTPPVHKSSDLINSTTIIGAVIFTVLAGLVLWAWMLRRSRMQRRYING